MKRFEEMRVDEVAQCHLLCSADELSRTEITWSSSTFVRFIDCVTHVSNHTLSYNTMDPSSDWIEEMESKVENIICGMREIARSLCIDGSVDISVGMEVRRRKYSNTEGTRCQHCESWYDILCRNRTGDEFVADGTADTEQVFPILITSITELNDRIRFANNRRLLSLPHLCESLVLAPTVAAVVFHEIIGHGIEEHGCELLNHKIGPSCLNVRIFDPSDRCHDDEGIEPGRVELVREGIVRAFVADRQTALSRRIAPTGIARSPSHGVQGRARCTHLEIAPGMISGRDLIQQVNHGLWCSGISGARFSAGYAHIEISDARLIERGQLSQRVGHFGFAVSSKTLAKNLIVICSDSKRGRSARCTKHAESLPTANTSPTVLLQHTPVWQLPPPCR